MKIKLIPALILLLTIFNLPNQINAESDLDFYMNDFYYKSNEASKILKEIEVKLKQGSRVGLCKRQREAARLGIMANKSLIKAFEINGTEPPINEIKASQRRWDNLLNKC